MEPIELLQRLLTSLEAHEVDDGKAAWKSLQKAAGDVVKPWAPLLTFKHSWCPPPNGVLQRGLTEGGALRALVEATVARYPRELWEPVQEVPLKGVWWVSDRRWGDAPRMLARAYKKSFCVYDPRDLFLVETLKPSSLTEVVFAEDGGLRAMDGTKVLTRGPGETKWKKVHDFNDASATALSATVAAALQTVVTGEGDDAVAHTELHLFVFETGTATTFRLEGTDFRDPVVAGGTALLATNEGRLLISELGAALSGRAARRSGLVRGALSRRDGAVEP